MEYEVMLVCKGGKLLGPMHPNEVKQALDAQEGEVDFVITPTKGWMPLDSFLKWQDTSIETQRPLSENAIPVAAPRVQETPKWVKQVFWIFILMLLFSLGVFLVWLKNKFL